MEQLGQPDQTLPGPAGCVVCQPERPHDPLVGGSTTHAPGPERAVRLPKVFRPGVVDRREADFSIDPPGQPPVAPAERQRGVGAKNAAEDGEQKDALAPGKHSETPYDRDPIRETLGAEQLQQLPGVAGQRSQVADFGGASNVGFGGHFAEQANQRVVPLEESGLDPGEYQEVNGVGFRIPLPLVNGDGVGGSNQLEAGGDDLGDRQESPRRRELGNPLQARGAGRVPIVDAPHHRGDSWRDIGCDAQRREGSLRGNERRQVVKAAWPGCGDHRPNLAGRGESRHDGGTGASFQFEQDRVRPSDSLPASRLTAPKLGRTYMVAPYMEPPMPEREWKKGSAELLILSLIEHEPRHGYELGKLIESRSKGVLRFHVASLYPLLYRLEKRGWIEGRWVETAGQRRRRYYRLTADGKKVLAAQRKTWTAFAQAINRIAGVQHA